MTSVPDFVVLLLFLSPFWLLVIWQLYRRRISSRFGGTFTWSEDPKRFRSTIVAEIIAIVVVFIWIYYGPRAR